MNIDGVCFKLHITPELPYYIAIIKAFEQKPTTKEFVPVAEKSVMFSLLHIYLFKNLSLLDQKEGEAPEDFS